VSRGVREDVRQAWSAEVKASSMNRSESVLVRWLDAGERGDVEAFDALMHLDAVIQLRVVFRLTARTFLRALVLASP
jgi:hypothetical protein